VSVPDIWHEQTLREAQEWLEQHKEDGIRCPCCGQFAKIYTRKLNAAMARDLVWLVQVAALSAGEGNWWVDVPSRGPIALQRSRELAKLVHWGLVECKNENSTRGGRTSGLWRPTRRGVLFALGKLAVPKYVRLYNGQFLSYPTDMGLTTIREAFKSPFTYDDLWGKIER
jgi:hypothetical protein